MAYTKQNFVDGEKLTAAKMNHIEDGIYSIEEEAGNQYKELAEAIENFGTPNDAHINLNDEVYQYGFFTASGEYWESYNYGFVTVNFLPVIGSRTLEAYCTQELSSGYLCVAEYDYKRKFIQRQNLSPRNMSWGSPKSIVLSNDTKYIRLCVPATTDIKDTVQLSVFYSENAVDEYVPYEEVTEGNYVDYSRILNVETVTAKIFSTVEAMQHSADLEEGAICETLGYHSENDGGGAKYIITATANTSVYQETLRNGLYATLMHDGVINVKQLGAYGDDSNDDTSAFQKAFDIATTCVYIPEGKYKITSTVVISNKERLTVNAENSYIAFRGTSGYCFKVVRSFHCNFNFGLVLASSSEADGCMEIYSANVSEGTAYIDVHFKSFRSNNTCVYIHADTDGWANEIRFHDGRVQVYDTGDAAVGFKIESGSSETTMDRYSFCRVGIEGVHTGIYIIGAEEVEEGTGRDTLGVPQFIDIIDCRACESFTKILKTEGHVRRIMINTPIHLNDSFFDFSSKTRYSMIYAPYLHELRGVEVATLIRVHNGVILPQNPHRVYNTLASSIDLTAKGHADSAYRAFYITEENAYLKLSKVYGTKYGVNTFKVVMLGKHADGFVIYDSDGNVVCDGTNIGVGDVFEFEWFDPENASVGWIATKMNTIPLIASE